MKRDLPDLPESYQALLQELKGSIRQARFRAAVAVKRELIVLYWHIGHEIRARQRQEGWGARIIDRFAEDQPRAFPEMQGLSPRNLKYMRAFFLVPPVALVEKLKNPEERLWYAGTRAMR